MKFLCDQCKAKYQISDDKVAGKTVRMKCRKCGHMIEVRAAVTETSVASSLPSEPPTMAGVTPGGPPKAPPAKPSVLPKSPLATSLSAAKPAPPRPATVRPEGLANAFNKQIQKEDDAALLELGGQDEWYAAINGVPVGPIRVGELRRKAALGAVTDDSLVWQEGMEEWRPVRAIAELSKIVAEAAASGRVAHLSPESPPVKSIPPAPAVPRMGPKPTPPRPPPPRSNVVPITSRLATAEKLEEAPAAEKDKKSSSPPDGPTSERFSVAPDPFAMPGAGAAGGLLVPTPAPPMAAVASAKGALATPAAMTPPPSAQAPVIIQKAPPNYIGIGVMLTIPVFGAVAAWAIFFKQPAAAPPPQIIVQQAPAPVAPAAPTATADPAPSASAKVAIRGPAAKPTTNTPAAPAGKGIDVSGLLNNGPGSPSLPTSNGSFGSGPSGGPASGGANGISGDQIEQVVNAHKLGVRRTCMEKGGSGVANSKTIVHLKIGGDGNVSSAISEGNDPVTGKCLENEIQKWHFPGGPATVDIPFSFVRQ